ncbi:MAG: peptide chain release factor N(5)-glutamine methyltransferase [Candidatus Sungbacteria bacterium]|nr:peptide chain release factor N(5)-glutamine methyltransferase [Candidatus Sungbacteria bacterium]
MISDQLGIEHLLREKYKLDNAFSVAQDVRRLLKGEPLDYVIGRVPFLGCHIDLSLKPFIPRPETEYWVNEVIRSLKARSGSLRVLDVFAGSGCIGIAVLKHLPNSHVTFAEKNPRFIEQIKINIKKNGIAAGRFCVVRSDIFKNIKGRFDVILANPPYVGAGNHVDLAVKEYEPRVAYYGGQNGLMAIRRFLKDAKPFVRPGGEIWMEHGAGQRREIRKLFLYSGYEDFLFHNDQYGRPRYVIIRNISRAA